MKTIVCFGDSNTWGFNPSDGSRHARNVRWPGVLQKLLGTNYHVVEEGLCGRTTAWEDSLSSGRNGLTYLPVALDTHSPIDLLIIMLGTNDLKTRLDLSAFSIAQGAEKLLKVVKQYEPKIPHVLLISPAHIVATDSVENTLGFKDGIEKSIELATHYQYFAKKYSYRFLDASTFAKSSELDGIHLAAEEHKLLAEGVSQEVRNIFG